MKRTASTLFNSVFLIACAFTLSAQSVINSQSFDALTVPALPAGWSTTTIYGFGWRTDSSNASNGYPGASGLFNCYIRNSDSSGTYSLLSPVFSTVGYTNLSVLFASRVSNNFPNSGSTVPGFEFTINGGQTWLNIPYLENNANSTWSWVNGGFRIDLPPTAENQPALQFRWRVNIVNNSQGTYRIDDFDFQGVNTSGITEMIYGNRLKIFPNPAVKKPVRFSFPDSFHCINILVFDALGRMVRHLNTEQHLYEMDTSELLPGVYLVRAVDKNDLAIYGKLIIY